MLLAAGVFLGIQAANWDDARRAHERERAYLGRIASELDESVLKLQQGNAVTRGGYTTDLAYGKEVLAAAQDLRDRVRAELGQPPMPGDAGATP